MEPRVIGRFGAAGNDGRRYTVEVVKKFHWVDGDKGGNGRWAEHDHTDYRTESRQEVARTTEGADGFLFVVKSNVRLTPDITFAQLASLVRPGR